MPCKKSMVIHKHQVEGLGTPTQIFGRTTEISTTPPKITHHAILLAFQKVPQSRRKVSYYLFTVTAEVVGEDCLQNRRKEKYHLKYH